MEHSQPAAASACALPACTDHLTQGTQQAPGARCVRIHRSMVYMGSAVTVSARPPVLSCKGTATPAGHSDMVALEQSGLDKTIIASWTHNLRQGKQKLM